MITDSEEWATEILKIFIVVLSLMIRVIIIWYNRISYYHARA